MPEVTESTTHDTTAPPRHGFKALVYRWRGPFSVVAVTCCFFWRVLFTRQYTDWNNPDLADQVLPWFAFAARQLRAGHLPLWDPTGWGGQTLIGQDQPGVCYPLNWLLFLVAFPGHTIHALVHRLDIYLAVIHILGALAFYALMRELQRTRLAAVLSALAFTTSAYMSAIAWPQRLNGAILTPLVFLFFARVWQGRAVIRNSVWAGAWLGVALLSGHHEAPVFIALGVLGAWGYLIWERRATEDHVPLWKGLALFLVTTVLVGGVQVLPSAEYGRLALRWVNANNPVGWGDKVPYSVHAALSLKPQSILGILIPWVGDPLAPLLGWTVVIVAAIAVICGWRSRLVRLFFSVALGGLLFSLGPYSIFDGVLYAIVPEVEKARSVAYATLLFGFGACVLFGFGLDALPEFRPLYAAWCKRLQWSLAVGGALLIGVAFLGYELGPKMDNNYLVISGLAALLVLGVLSAFWAGSIRARTACVLLGGVMAFELGNGLPQQYSAIERGWSFVEPLGQYNDVVQFMRAQPNHPRLYIDDNAIPFNIGDLYNIDVFNEYLASMTKNIFEFFGEDVHRAEMLFASEYTASKNAPVATQTRVFDAANGVHIYRNTDAFPRAWIAHQAVSVSKAEGARRLQSNDRLREQPYFLGPAPKLEQCSSTDTANVAVASGNKMVIDADTSCRALLVDADTFYPGWVARVDGRRAPVLEVFGTMRGVVIPAGHHRVEFMYRPTSVLIGAVMTLTGLAIAFWLWFANRRTYRHAA